MRTPDDAVPTLAVRGTLAALCFAAVASTGLTGQAVPGERVATGAAPAPGPRETEDPPGCWIREGAQDLDIRISKLDSASVELGDGTVKVCYSRPRKLDRPVMGRLVPYGEPWRLGANEATAVHVSSPVEIAGVAVEAGWYSLYAIPDRESWEIVVNEEARRWGVPIDEDVRAADVGTGTVPVDTLSDTVERMAIRLQRVSADSAEMVISWERVRVRVPVVARDHAGETSP